MLKKISSITFLNILSQIVSLCCFILISKIVSTDLLGDYIIFITYTAIFSMLSTCFYEQSLFIDKELKDSKEQLGILVIIPLFSCLIFGCLLSLFRFEHALAVSIVAFCGGIKVVARSFAIVKGNIVKLSVGELLISPIIPLSIVASVYFNEDSDIKILISVYVFASVLISLFFLWYFFLGKSINIAPYSSLSLNSLLAFIKRYSKLLIYKTPTELVNSLCLRIPIFIIEKYFSLSIAAFYGVAFRVLLTPVTIITSTASQLFIHKVSNVKSESDSVLGLFYQYVLILSTIATFGAVLVYYFSSPIIILFFSSEYQQVSDILVRFIPYLLYLIIIAPLLSVFVIYEQQQELLFANISILIFTLVSYYFAVQENDILLGIFLFSCVMFLTGLLLVKRMVYWIKKGI